MADLRQPNVAPKGIAKPKSFSTDFLCKMLVLAALMLAIPMFPVRAPQFLTHPLAIKYWEPIRLLFIGLAVSCGCSVFHGRNGEPDYLHVSHAEESQSSFVSRIFHVNPIFEDGFDYTDEKVVRFHDHIYVDKEVVRSGFAASSIPINEGFSDGRREGVPPISDKPLGLPVRSLVSEIIDSNVERIANEPGKEEHRVEEDESHFPQVISRSQSLRSSGSSEEQVVEERSKSFRSSYPSTPVTKGATLNAFHLRRYSSGSLFKKTQVKDFSVSTSVGEAEVMEKIKEPEVADAAEKVRIGKSVRSFRPHKHLADAQKTAPEEIPITKFEKEHIEPVKVPQKERRRKTVKVDPIEEADYVPEKIELPINEEGYESSEVDRKAGEFIAKFKQQIRLQKEASIDRSRASRLSSTHFR